MSSETLEVLQSFQYILTAVGMLCIILCILSVPAQNAAPFAGLAALSFTLNAILFVLTKDTGEAVLVTMIAVFWTYIAIEVQYLES